MVGMGTIINVLAIIVGGLLDRVCGVSVLFLGIAVLFAYFDF